MKDIDMSKATPTEMEAYLRQNSAASIQEPVLLSSNQIVRLSYRDGVFIINWRADNIPLTDKVALYDNQNKSDKDYIQGQYEMAKDTREFTTNVGVRAGVQARYLIFDANKNKYVSVARTNPYPELIVRAFK